jgi:hypothetical protein
MRRRPISEGGCAHARARACVCMYVCVCARVCVCACACHNEIKTSRNEDHHLGIGSSYDVNL